MSDAVRDALWQVALRQAAIEQLRFHTGAVYDDAVTLFTQPFVFTDYDKRLLASYSIAPF